MVLVLRVVAVEPESPRVFHVLLYLPRASSHNLRPEILGSNDGLSRCAEKNFGPGDIVRHGANE